MGSKRVYEVMVCGLVMIMSLGDLRGETKVEVVETFPAGKWIELKQNETYYLRLRYTTDEPTHLWARPFYRGKEVSAGSNPSRLYPVGSGEALGWFFFFDAGLNVDEVRVSAGSGAVNGTKVVLNYPVTLWTVSGSARDAVWPEWLEVLTKENEKILDSERRKTEAEPMSTGGMLIVNGFMYAVLAVLVFGVGWPVLGIWFWRGVWRVLAVIPVAVVVFVIGRIIVDGLRDSTSHNLWPFEILIWCGLATLWMGVLTAIRKIVGAGKEE